MTMNSRGILARTFTGLAALMLAGTAFGQNPALVSPPIPIGPTSAPATSIIVPPPLTSTSLTQTPTDSAGQPKTAPVTPKPIPPSTDPGMSSRPPAFTIPPATDPNAPTVTNDANA